MKSILFGLIAGIALCSFSLAQDTTPSDNRSPEAAQQSDTLSPAPQAPTAQPNASQGSAPQPATPQSATPQSTAPEPASAQPAASPRIAPGSVIPVQLTRSVDAKKAKTGDEVQGKVTQDMKNNSGVVLVPKDTKILGHVTEVQAHSKEQKESQLGIAFDRAVLKDGGDMQLPMSIQAVIAPPSVSSDSAAGAEPSSPSGVPQNAPSNTPQNDRPSAMGTAAPPPAPGVPAAQGTGAASQNTGRQPITGNTQGIVGFSNMSLTRAASATQGSLITSDKNNVKLESGTLLLLRVIQ